MITIKRLLSPTDFSDASKHALEYAVDLAKSYGAELHIVHVIEPVMYPADMFGQVGLVDVETTIEQAGRDELAEWRKKNVPADLPCVTAIKHGRPFAEILEYAAACEIDLIVIATHGRNALDHFLLGSTTEKIVRKAPCPVLTVRSHEREILNPTS